MAKWAWACFPFGGFALIVEIDYNLNELDALSGNWDVSRDAEWSICRRKSCRKLWGRYILHRASRWYQEAKRRILYGEGVRVIYFLNEINARLKIEAEIDECPCDSLSLVLLNGNHSLSSLLTLFLLITSCSNTNMWWLKNCCSFSFTKLIQICSNEFLYNSNLFPSYTIEMDFYIEYLESSNIQHSDVVHSQLLISLKGLVTSEWFDLWWLTLY